MVDLLNKIISRLVNPAIGILIALAVLYILYSVYVFIRDADNGDKRKENGLGILYGIVGLAIMISAYGIVNFVLRSIGI